MISNKRLLKRITRANIVTNLFLDLVEMFEQLKSSNLKGVSSKLTISLLQMMGEVFPETSPT